MKVALGGTFDVLHRGHKELIRAAFSLSKDVIIGLTSDSFAEKMKKRKVNSFARRKKAIEDFLQDSGFHAEMVELNDEWGPVATDPQVRWLVVSEETYPKALKANALREKNKLEPVCFAVIPLVKVSEGKISASTLRKEYLG